MASTERFPHWPECCRTVLHDLDEQAKTGSRNCVKGHAVSLQNAVAFEAKMAAKEAAEKATEKATEDADGAIVGAAS